MSDADEAPGWDAIEATLATVYPGEEPDHWGTLVNDRVIFGGPEVIDGLSAYAAAEPRPHRHWVTFGLTELYAKESENREWSGWGYELTMRAGELDVWPRELLRRIANWAHAQQVLLRPGTFMDLGAPVAGDQPCDLHGWGLVADPTLPAIDSPHGRVEFIEVVALHPQELGSWRRHGGDEMIRRVGERFTADLNMLVRPALLGA